MKKRGLSDIVTAVLMILLVVVALMVIWGFLRGFILEETEISTARAQTFQEGFKITKADIIQEDGTLSLSLEGLIQKDRGVTRTTETTTVTNSIPADIVSVVDTSGSMVTCSDFSPIDDPICISQVGGRYFNGQCEWADVDKEGNCINLGGEWTDRLSPAQQANERLIDEFLDEGDVNRVALVEYDSDVHNTSLFSFLDTPGIPEARTFISGWLADDATRTCLGILKAIDLLSTQSSDERIKAIIVMSDGIPDSYSCNELDGAGNGQEAAVNASRRANNTLENLTIYAIGFGDNADEATLTAIANEGGGEYYSANDANLNTLIDRYQFIAEQLTQTTQSIQLADRLRLVIYTSDQTFTKDITNIPANVYETSSFNIDLNELGINDSSEVEKIELYPIITTASGTEVIGPLLDTWNF